MIVFSIHNHQGPHQLKQLTPRGRGKWVDLRQVVDVRSRDVAEGFRPYNQA